MRIRLIRRIAIFAVSVAAVAFILFMRCASTADEPCTFYLAGAGRSLQIDCRGTWIQIEAANNWPDRARIKLSFTRHIHRVTWVQFGWWYHPLPFYVQTSAEDIWMRKDETPAWVERDPPD